jgi:hypothetical protein
LNVEDGSWRNLRLLLMELLLLLLTRLLPLLTAWLLG